MAHSFIPDCFFLTFFNILLRGAFAHVNLIVCIELETIDKNIYRYSWHTNATISNQFFFSVLYEAFTLLLKIAGIPKKNNYTVIGTKSTGQAVFVPFDEVIHTAHYISTISCGKSNPGAKGSSKLRVLSKSRLLKLKRLPCIRIKHR